MHQAFQNRTRDPVYETAIAPFSPLRTFPSRASAWRKVSQRYDGLPCSSAADQSSRILMPECARAVEAFSGKPRGVSALPTSMPPPMTIASVVCPNHETYRLRHRVPSRSLAFGIAILAGVIALGPGCTLPPSPEAASTATSQDEAALAKLRQRVQPPHEQTIATYIEAGAEYARPHALSDRQWALVEEAFASLPPLYQRILAQRLDRLRIATTIRRRADRVSCRTSSIAKPEAGRAESNASDAMRPASRSRWI